MRNSNPTATVDSEAFGNYNVYDDHFDNELADVLKKYGKPSRTVELDSMFVEEEDEE